MTEHVQILADALRTAQHSPVDISSAANPRLKQLRGLLESARERRRSGQTVLDGWHLLDAWLQQGRAVQQIILPRRTLKKFDEADIRRPSSFQDNRQARQADARSPASERAGAADTSHSDRQHARQQTETQQAREPGAHATHVQLLQQARWLILDDALFDSLDILPSPSPVLALVDAPQPEPPEVFGKNDIVVLDRVQDPGNVGTIVRTAAAAGIRTVLTTPGTAACWSPKVLRAGMGGHFVLDIVENLDARELCARVKLPLAGTLLSPQAVSLYRQDLRAPLAWVFGSEGEGIDPALQARLQIRLMIPQQPGVESLNVAAASAICLFEQRRQRLTDAGT